MKLNRIQRILLAIISVGFCFGPVGGALAQVMIRDQYQFYQEGLYMFGSGLNHFDETSTNVQQQTGDAVAKGSSLPTPEGEASAEGVIEGILQYAKQVVYGQANYKTWLKAAVKQLIKDVLADAKSWAKKGFKGTPNFIKDWKSFIQGAALAASAEFIKQWPLLSQFCTPQKITLPRNFFEAKLSVQEKTTSKFAKKSNMPGNQCTIEKIVQNLSGVSANYKGSLTSFVGGWNKKGGSTISVGLMHPQNNALGLFFLGQDERTKRVAQKTAAAKDQAITNKGFLNIVDANGCFAPNPETGERACPAEMAGKFVQKTMTKAGLGEYADMIDMNDMNDLLVSVASGLMANLAGSIVRTNFNTSISNIGK